MYRVTYAMRMTKWSGYRNNILFLLWTLSFLYIYSMNIYSIQRIHWSMNNTIQVPFLRTAFVHILLLEHICIWFVPFRYHDSWTLQSARLDAKKEIKNSFKKFALRYHPDRLLASGASEEEGKNCWWTVCRNICGVSALEGSREESTLWSCI